MGYFDSPENVEEYIQIADGYDGRELIEVLRRHLEADSTVLELGMGPGKDLDLLSEHYRVTGSDQSEVFIERYRHQRPTADLILLDAATIETNRRFDAIYSNKVLHHLTRNQLAASFRRQPAVLNEGGIALHSFWYGDKEEELSGLRFVFHTEDSLDEAIGRAFEIVEAQRYTEIEEDDSIYLVLRRRDHEQEGPAHRAYDDRA